MKSSPSSRSILIRPSLAALLLAASPLWAAESSAPASALPPLTSADIPRETQSGPPVQGRGIPVAFPADAKLPTLWLIGDSTVRNGTAGDGGNGQWGWGAPLVAYFDAKKINVVNRAAGGTSSRTFYQNNWKKMQPLLKKGDVVIMQFGTNDGRNPANSVGSLRGLGEETQEVTREGAPETVQTFGWYLRKFVAETRAVGATPIICSLIPRKSWDSAGHIARSADTFAGWAAEVAKTEKAGFIDLNERIAQQLDALGKEKVDLLYHPPPSEKSPAGEHVHPGWEGSVLNAETVVTGLKALPENPVAPYFSPRGAAVSK